jgi:hypothetical protein
MVLGRDGVRMRGGSAHAEMTCRSHCAQLQGELRLQRLEEAAGGAIAAARSTGSALIARLYPAADAEELFWAGQATTSDERGRSSDHMDVVRRTEMTVEGRRETVVER